MILRRRLLVSGRVQGVGYRAFATDVARREGIHGTIRNLTDGRVEADVEGEREALARFERALHQGPPLSDVVAVEAEPLPPRGRADGFVVRG